MEKHMTTTVESLWTVDDVATYLRIPKKTLYYWRYRNYGPPSRRFGKYLRYDPGDVVAWARQHN